MALCDLFVHPPAITFSVNLLIYLYLLFLKLFRFRLLVSFRIFSISCCGRRTLQTYGSDTELYYIILYVWLKMKRSSEPEKKHQQLKLSDFLQKRQCITSVRYVVLCICNGVKLSVMWSETLVLTVLLQDRSQTNRIRSWSWCCDFASCGLGLGLVALVLVLIL